MISPMGMPEDLLERREIPLYLYYSTFGRNPATIASISYFLNAAHGHVRFDINTGSVVSRCCWQSRTSALAMMLQKCTTILILSLCLKSRFRDLVRWHQGSSMRNRGSIARMCHRISITSQLSVFEAHIKLCPFDSSCHLYSFGPSRGTPPCHSPLDGFVKLITSLVRSSLLILGPVPLLLCVTALGMKKPVAMRASLPTTSL
jgi:hypothetical protein